MSLAVLADHMASKGRGPDSMLIHMSPTEVQGLQALAMRHGGSLTINPETGLPEAGFLDKLLPTIIGAGISFFSQGTIDPMTAAAMVGGAQTVRTGDIGKGIQAGLGAYSGASLTAGMAGTGADAMTTAGMGNYAETLAAQGLQAGTPAYGEAASQLALESQKEALATPFADRLSTGYEAVKKAGPMQYLKTNAMPLAGAFGPAIFAGMSAKENMPKTTTGMIAPHTFDPYSGTYTAGVPYPASPNRAAEGGLMGLAAGGIAGYGDGDDVPRQNGMAQGGMYDFAQRSEPVVRMAEGGIAHFAAGGDAALAAYQSGNYGEASRLLAEAGMSAQDVVSKYGLSQADAAAVAKNLGYAGDMSGLQYAAAPPVVQAAAAPVVQAAAAPVVQAAAAAPAYTQYTPEQMGSYLANNKDINLQDAIKATNADPTAVNAYIASLTSPFVGSTATTGGSGTLGIYNQMTNIGVDPTEFYSAAIANDPKYAGWTKEMIQRGYDLDKGAYALSAQIEKDKIAADPKLGYDKQWVKFMEDNKYSVDDMAQAFGISKNEIQRRINDVKAAETKVVTKTALTCPAGYRPNAAGTACELIGVREIFNPPGTGGGTTIIPGINDYGLGGTGTSGSLESVYGPSLPPGVSGAGITTVNPNGTITTRPDLTLGMSTVRDDYVRGGGSLGYTSPTFASLKAVEDKYPLRGGSKQSYDYLTGKTDYSPVPYTKTGELMKPYGESVLGIPAAMSKKMYLFDPATKQYKINPDYVIPTRDSAGKVTTSLTNKDVTEFIGTSPADDTFLSWMTANNLSPEQIATATGMSIAEVYKKIKKAKPIEKVVDASTTAQNDASSTGGEANGGLMKLAGGGMSGQFNLGDYSDGGRLLRGPGDGVSDSIPASIGGKRPARLADGEFVVPARIVSELGNGSTEAGARKLYAMMDRIQSARRGTVGKGRVAKNSRSEKYLPA